MAFIYKEIIPDRYIDYIPDSLNLSKSIYLEAKIIRLLLGTADFNSTFDNLEIIQRKNYSNALELNNSIISAKIIRDSFKPLTLNDIDNYFKKFKNVNYNLHKDLLFELSLYFFNQTKNNHVISFLH